MAGQDADAFAFATLRQMVQDRVFTGRDWHLDDLHHHRLRYLADLGLVRQCAPAGEILEIGSAPCHMTALLKLTGRSVVGADINPARVADLVRNLALDVRQCDIEHEPLPLADASFDCALLCETFEHLRVDPLFVLSEIHRVLKEGAPLILTTPNVYSIASLGRFLVGRSVADPLEEFGKLRALGHMGHVREYSAREVSRFLRGCGFAVESVQFRFHATPGGWKRKLLHLAYRALPRGYGRELVIIARKTPGGPSLQPLGAITDGA